jgi:hypothetical protein
MLYDLFPFPFFLSSSKIDGLDVAGVMASFLSFALMIMSSIPMGWENLNRDGSDRWRFVVLYCSVPSFHVDLDTKYPTRSSLNSISFSSVPLFLFLQSTMIHSTHQSCLIPSGPSDDCLLRAVVEIDIDQ